MATAIRDDLKPSVKWYAASFSTTVFGLCIMAFHVMHGLSSFFETMPTLPAPGRTEVGLATPGAYTIFHEYVGVHAGTGYEGEPGIENLTVTVTPKEGGEPLPLIPANPNNRYDYGGREGEAAYVFDIPAAGVYVVTARPKEGATVKPTLLSVTDKVPMAELGVLITNAIFILLATILLAVGIFVTVFYLRQKDKQRRSGGRAKPNRVKEK